MAFAAVISLQRTIDILKRSPRISLIPPSAETVDLAYRELKSLQQILKRLDKSSKGDCRKKINAVDERIKETVWKFEDLLDSHFYNQILSQSELSCSDIQLQLQELRADVEDFIHTLKKMEEDYIYELDHLIPEEAVRVDVPLTTDSDARRLKMVGSSSSDILIEIKEELKPDYYFNVISIEGMAGIGKTMLAEQIFHDSLFEFGFICRAWITIGRNCRLNELERDILVQLDPDFDKMSTEEDERKEYLKRIVKDKRCLIVLDDVWDTSVWDHLKQSLPVFEESRSRVLVTTRLHNVAQYFIINWSTEEEHKMQLLDKDESWLLLRERVFGEEYCPTELEKYGKKIAEKCDGLPLMIVTVATLLLESELTAEYWKSVAEDRKSAIFMVAYDQLCEVLFPSYEYLPQHLKPCFLYVGVFLQNYEVSKLDLFRMWIAEGFLESKEIENLEGYARTYLGKLIEHNVLLKCQASSNFGFGTGTDVKTCRLQSAFWHLCHREAKKNKFFHVLTSLDDGLEECVESQRRLSFHNNILLSINDVYASVEDGCSSTARSLLCLGPFYPYTVPICFSLRLLKVLDALQIRFYEFPTQVLQLIHLRYLALTYNGELPCSISKLLNLQVFIMHRYMSIFKSCGAPTYVPIEIWDMKELRHIQVMGTNLPNTSNDSSLGKLLTLKGVSAQTCTKEVLERIPNLRKLGVEIQLLPDDDMKVLHCLSHIDVLSELRSLKCFVVNPKLSREIVTLPAPLSMFPSSLTKLHLSGLGYPWEYMSIIGSLPELEVLKLRCYAFRGPKWEVKNGEFRRLHHLLIEDTDLVQLKVEFGGFSCLESLCLNHCYKIQDIQFDWYNILQDIVNHPYRRMEVIDCSPSTVAFAYEMRSRWKRKLQFLVHSSWMGRKQYSKGSFTPNLQPKSADNVIGETWAKTTWMSTSKMMKTPKFQSRRRILMIKGLTKKVLAKRRAHMSLGALARRPGPPPPAKWRI